MKIYRASETTQNAPGCCWATTLEGAELFLSGADGGAQGRSIYSLEVTDSPVSVETLADLAALVSSSTGQEPGELLIKWESYGWDRVWQALDSSTITAVLAASPVTWVSYEDEGPDGQGGLVCWRYYGDAEEMKEEA